MLSSPSHWLITQHREDLLRLAGSLMPGARRIGLYRFIVAEGWRFPDLARGGAVTAHEALGDVDDVALPLLLALGEERAVTQGVAGTVSPNQSACAAV